MNPIRRHSQGLACRSVARSKVRAFTLVELLVVIGIIAVLIAILLPALSRARSQASSVVCQSSLRQVGIALRMYADANKNSFPFLKFPDWSGQTHWFQLLTPYLKKNADADNTATKDVAQVLRACPDYVNGTTDPSRLGYGMNDRMMLGQGVYPTSSTGGSKADFWWTNLLYSASPSPTNPGVTNSLGVLKFNNFRKPAATIIFGDSDNWMLELSAISTPPYWQFRTAASATSAGATDVAAGSSWYKCDPTRHGKRAFANYLFLDYHVESLTPADALTALTGKRKQ